MASIKPRPKAVARCATTPLASAGLRQAGDCSGFPTRRSNERARREPPRPASGSKPFAPIRPTRAPPARRDPSTGARLNDRSGTTGRCIEDRGLPLDPSWRRTAAPRSISADFAGSGEGSSREAVRPGQRRAVPVRLRVDCPASVPLSVTWFVCVARCRSRSAARIRRCTVRSGHPRAATIPPSTACEGSCRCPVQHVNRCRGQGRIAGEAGIGDFRDRRRRSSGVRQRGGDPARVLHRKTLPSSSGGTTTIVLCGSVTYRMRFGAVEDHAGARHRCIACAIVDCECDWRDCPGRCEAVEIEFRYAPATARHRWSAREDSSLLPSDAAQAKHWQSLRCAAAGHDLWRPVCQIAGKQAARQLAPRVRQRRTAGVEDRLHPDPREPDGAEATGAHC